MSLRKIISGSFAVLFLLSATVLGQASDTEGRGGSVYSYYGLGFPIDVTSDAYKAYGALGVSGVGVESMSINNPALWGRAIYTEATTGLQISKHNLSTQSANSANFSFETNFIHLLFPLSRGKAGLSVGLYPVTRANFRSVINETLQVSQTDTISYSNDLQSRGGVNKFEVGFGFKINNNISVGYAPSVAFLTLENTEYLTFRQAFVTQDLRTKITGAAFSQRFGISGDFRGLFKEDDRLNIGATLNLPFSINADQEYTTEKFVDGGQEEVNLTNTLPSPSGDIDMPLESSFGIGYAPSDFLSIAVEGLYQQWGEYNSEIRPGQNDFLTDRFKIGVGGQFHPYKRNSDQFLSRFKYSAGLSYDTGHLTIQGNEINTLWLNTGLGIFSRSASSLDVSFRYGFRGTTDNNLVKERIWALGISVNLTELMFVRPKLR